MVSTTPCTVSSLSFCQAYGGRSSAPSASYLAEGGWIWSEWILIPNVSKIPLADLEVSGEVVSGLIF